MAKSKDTVVPSENENEVNVAETKKQKEATTLMDQVVNEIATNVKSFIKSSDAKDAETKVKAILNTVFALNALDEYAIGVKVDGELYRFSDYEGPSGIGSLIVPERVVVVDNPTAKDFLDHDAFKVTGQIVSPATFKLYEKRVCSYLRLNPEFHALSRPSVGLLSDATKYAVNGRKVVDAKQTTLYFLTVKCDDEARVSLSDWAKMITLTIFA